MFCCSEMSPNSFLKKMCAVFLVYQCIIGLSSAQVPFAVTFVGKYGLYFYNNSLPKMNASAACQTQQSYLVQIKTDAIQKVIEDVIRPMADSTEATSPPNRFLSSYWCGASNPSDRPISASVVWDDSTPSTYTNWYGGEPNDWKERCVIVSAVNTYQHRQNLFGKWLDFPCGLKLRFYICQRVLLETNSTDLVVSKFSEVFLIGRVWFIEIIEATVSHVNTTNIKHNLVSSSGIPKIFNYSINIQSVNDAGKYLLTLSGRLSSSLVVTQSALFTVYVPASISLTASTINVGMNRTNAYIDCVSFGYSIPSVVWYRGSTPLSHATTEPVFQRVATLGYSVVSRLELSNATRTESGTYVCKVTNFVGSSSTLEMNAEAKAHVFVEYAPEFNSSIPQNRKAVPFYKQLNLSCTFEAVPLSTIYWSVNGASVSSGDSAMPLYTVMNHKVYQTTSTLVIYNPVILGPKANMSCHAKNTHGKTAAKYFSLDLDYFRPNYFLFASVRKNFQNARSVCQKYGGDLVIISTNKTQQFIQSRGTFYADQNQWMTTKQSAYIGAKRNSGVLAWLNSTQLDKTFNQWSERQPMNYECVFLSNTIHDSPRFSWQTGYCRGERHFVCQFKAQPVTFLPSPPVNCTAHQLLVRWQDTTAFNGKIIFKLVATTNASGGIQTVYSETKTIQSTGNHEYQTLLDNLNAQNYRIQVVLFPQFWNFPVPMETILSTRVAVANKARNLALTLSLQTCTITWMWPTNINLIEITGYKLNTTTKLHLFAFNASSLAAWQETQTFDVSMKNVFDRRYHHNVTLLPNQVLTVSIQVLTCSAIGILAIAQGNCTTPPKEPDFVPALKKSNVALSVTVSPVDEMNGPVSCYFIVGMEAGNTNNPVQQISTWRELQSVLAGNVSSWHCAVTIPRFTGNPITKTIGNKSVSACDVKTNFTSNLVETYTCRNPPLTSNISYKFVVVTTTAIGSSVAVKSSSFVEITPNDTGTSAPIGLIVGISVGFLLLAFIIILVICLRKRNFRKSKNPETNVAFNTRAQVVSHEPQPNETLYENVADDVGGPIVLSKLLDTYDAYSHDRVTYNTQFQKLKEAQDRLSLDKSVATETRNTERNRYKNILPYDFNRVRLEGRNSVNNNYINASYINGYNGNVKFIAAQGPRPATVQHFWQMIWEQNCKTILMLMNVFEKTKEKCEKYWPEPNESLQFGKYLVITNQEESYGSYVVRALSVTRSDLSECHYVTHYHYAAWPDHGVPVSTSGLLRFHRVIKESQVEDGPPILVHCSAGVGRTGTYIGLDILEQQMTSQRQIDVFSTVLKMREQRTDMVQNVHQYILMHKLLVEIHTIGDTDLPSDNFAEHCAHQQTLKREFEMLDLVPPLETSQSKARHSANLESSRDSAVLPYDRSLVSLSGDSANLYENKVFINASFVKDYEDTNSMIVTQGPMSSNTNLFWQMICDHNVAAIIMLTSLDRDMCDEYWTDEVDSQLQLSYINVTMTAKTDLGQDITRRQFYVEELEGSLSVTHLQCDVTNPGDENTKVERLLELVSQAHSLRQQHRPIVVHCRDGAGRSGVFCALSNLLDRCRIENRIDVFRTVKDLRDMRPLMVPTLGDYLLLYKAAHTHVSARSIYANV